MESSTPTGTLAEWALSTYHNGVSPEVEREANRSFLNALAAGIGGSTTADRRALLAGEGGAWGSGDAPVLGTSQRLPPPAAATCNAFSVTQEDFDDAHPETIVHPGAAALAGLFAVLHRVDVSGRQVLRAYAVACESQLAIAVARSRSHYEKGWHTTSTCAPFGAAVAAGLVLGLGSQDLSAALESSARRIIGLREAHGTTLKGYQVGRAAASGVRAALSPHRGGRSLDALAHHPGATEGLTGRQELQLSLPDPMDVATWEISRVMYKPYPAGVVCATGIEAALDLHGELLPEEIESIEIRVSPLVIQLAGNCEPEEPMQARVSLPHGVAVALATGRAGMAEFSEPLLSDPEVYRLRRLVRMVPVERRSPTWVEIRVRVPSGVMMRQLEDPLGGPTRPLTDEALEDKARGLIELAFPGAGSRIIEAVWTLTENGPMPLVSDVFREP